MSNVRRNAMLKLFRNLFAQSPSPKVIEKREKLYEQYFGATPKIYHSTNKVFPHIDVYHFEPTQERPFHTLITGGMAEYRQPVDEGPTRLELLIYVRTFQWWAANLLKMVAEYPAQYQTFFAAYHTIPMGYRLTDTAEISAFLLAPTEIEDSSRLSFAIEGESVDYLACVPITMIEHAFAREVSSKQLHQRLKEANLLIHADDERRSSIDYTPKEIE
jgi:Suppressor of fused protein (SUFU)